ncbi:MAG: serine/threonine protein kinase [Deltaproteobacteria bacterium]|nr:serine/threonine protein kinase [Deltaproteobacteria bacterium]
MSDPLLSARELLNHGDVTGAERVLAVSVIDDDAHAARATRALVAICMRSGEVGFRAHQAFDALAARGAAGPAAQDLLFEVAELYRHLRIDDAALDLYNSILQACPTHLGARQARDELTGKKGGGALPELPDLDGFGAPPAAVVTEPLPRPQSLADVEVVPLAPAPVVEEPRLAVPAPSAAAQKKSPSGSGGSSGSGAGADVMRAFPPGHRIAGRYQVVERVGRGGSATVLKVIDHELDETCALKVFHLTGAEADLQRFKREVSLSRKIVHENVVKLYDLGSEDGHYFLTMELLEGEDLGSLIKRAMPAPARALTLLMEACAGLQAAHTRGVVHRDIKPANLFVQREGPLKVMDFGIAKPADATTLTSTGVFLGTPQFVSPEQVRGKEVSAATDLYSLGVVMYLLFTGTLPFTDKEIYALLMKHANDAPAPPTSRNPTIPPLLEGLIVACLEKDPRRRPESADEVRETLQQVLARLG